VKTHIKKDAQFCPNNKVQLIVGGQVYFNLLVQLINNATESIHLQTYIFKDDETGKEIILALKNAIKRNVSVYLLVDGYASQSLSKAFITDIEYTGIKFRFFQPLFKTTQFYFGRRMHHKLFVVDAKYAVIGGINIANKYNDMPTQPAWLDFALYINGEIAQQLCILCWKTWNNFANRNENSPCADYPIAKHFSAGEKTLARIRRNDWVRRKNEISSTYIQMFRNAKSHITIVCSYFLPGRIIRKLLQNAAKRGVKIRIVTAGKSDIALAKSAERWLYDWLLRNNITLYEYQPTVLHAKLAIADGEWLTLGSYNVNNLSAYASIEINVDIQNKNFVAAAEETVENIITQSCINISLEKHKQNKDIFKQFGRWCSYHLIKAIFYTLTFYYKRVRT
jgi:cardiolipin synthase A/B